jgi:hypothetical protein
MPKKLKTLADILTPTNAARLNQIRAFARSLWAKEAVQHPFFTLHGPQHSQQVEQIIDDILALEHRDNRSLKKAIDPVQSFYLLASVWLHDTGMLVPPTGSELRAAKAQGVSVEEWIRREYHGRSRKYVEDHAKELGLEQSEAVVIGTISEAHRETRLTDLPGTYLNLRLLSALLRAADALDVTRARVPKELIGLMWGKMDSASRWHWVKHYCVAKARPCHEALEGGAPVPVFRLRYEYEVCLPDSRFLGPFRDRIIEPIRGVLEAQHVNLILETTGITIAFHHFEFTPLIGDQVLFGRTKLSQCLKALLPVPAPLPFAVVACIEDLRLKNPPAAAMLERYCQRFADAAFRLPDGGKFETALIAYMDALRVASDLMAIEGASGSFSRKCRTLLRGSAQVGSAVRTAEEECLMLAWLGWRLASFLVGDEATRKVHLVSVMHRLGGEADDLIRMAKKSDPSVSVRQLAASALAGEEG